MKSIPFDQAGQLPLWRRPITLLFVMAAAMPIAFSTWSALLNNFVIEAASFEGADIGLLHTVREIPGFLAVGVIAILLFVREQVLWIVSLALLACATAVTAWFPSLGGILTITMVSSIGFHYYETVNQSLQLQWLDKDKAPQMLGWIRSASAGATLVAYLLLVLTWEHFDLSYNFVYLVSGGLTLAIAAFCYFAYPRFEAKTPQHRSLILRKRYWLYYLLQFFAGARRQIFVVFAGFMMVERFGFEVHEITSLYLINLVANMIFAPFVGKAVAYFGERRALIFEYVGLILVFAAYGGIYMFYWGWIIASALYVIDHMLFSLALALKTYFQKIADPADIAPTAAVAFTINHIAAVFLPVLMGLLWMVSPAYVFLLAAGIACGSLVLSLLIPRNPEPGNETVLSKFRAPQVHPHA
ncbi:MFS transporter [Cochlodiniinecator piscidefendens]|uniref:MFS transporter n=1 Tax=Cochlodiniinecator piscidefendens TaxID=2715756 RepID=UPI00140B9EFC|nr:MFS transporter [Cochlodiniinecator piscidefendens]